MCKGKWVECHYGDKKKKVKICEGEIYIVDPINPLKKKYRGEKVKLIKSDIHGTKVLRLESEWHVKRNYYTVMDISDLKLLTEDDKNSVA
ncbi:MAG: hypothetical protein D3913_14615 [Candidatus Electrothrix sp. LOE1_4_5]|nr:hypothetical protein [Candidatus Electrothrix gigas]